MDDAVFRTHERLKAFPPAQLVFIIYRRIIEHGLRPTALWLMDKIVRRTHGYSRPNLSEVAAGLYVGGQHRRSGLPEMRDRGITAVVNMREESDDAVRGVALDHHLHLPTTDDTAPNLDLLDRGVAFIAQQRAAGRGVYIHCASGVGRAPTMAAAYLIAQGATPAEAWETIRRTRPFIRPTPPQLAVIEAFAGREDSPGRQI